MDNWDEEEQKIPIEHADPATLVQMACHQLMFVDSAAEQAFVELCEFAVSDGTLSWERIAMVC